MQWCILGLYVLQIQHVQLLHEIVKVAQSVSLKLLVQRFAWCSGSRK